MKAARSSPDRVKDVFDNAGVRAVVFVSILTFMLAGPVYHQVFDGESEWLRAWEMYGDNGLELVTFRFERLHDGEWQALDVESMLKATFGIAPRRMLRIKGALALERVKPVVCRAYPGARIRLSARLADRRHGWLRLAEREPLACEQRR